MAVVNILAFGMLALFFAIRWKEKLVDVLPMAACVLVLVLYVLAFFHRLSVIDILSCGFLIALGIAFARLTKEKKREIIGEGKRALLHPGVLAAAVLFAGSALLVSGRIATWWDDINFWATDVKALYALDGFAAKYTNAAPEFGDYPPGVQLLKWWFAHMKPDGFSEGLMFAGYYFAIFVFLLPLLGKLNGKNPLLPVLSVICLAAFPSVAEAFYCQGMCADLVMAVIYGAFLAAVMDSGKHEAGFQNLRLALYLAVLVLVKSVGFLWAAFGIAFLWIRARQSDRRKEGFRPLLFVTAAPLVTGGSWMVFCLLMRRVAKLTGAALSVAAGNLPILLPGTREKLVAAYLEAFAIWPLHRGKPWAVDLSPLLLFVLVCGLTAVFYKKKLLTAVEAKLLGIFLPVSGLVFYGINLVSHLTIFATEAQYLDPFGMVSSIERYGAPFTVGALYLLAFLALERSSGRTERIYLLCFGFVLLTANWPEVYRCFIGYRAELEEEKAARAEMITPQSGEFLEKLGRMDAGNGMRILYLKDVSDNQWVKNSYVAFEASPVSLIFGSVDPAVMNSGDMWNAMEASHAGYLYVDELSGDNGTELFAPFIGNFQTRTIYRIAEENGEIHLEELLPDALGPEKEF